MHRECESMVAKADSNSRVKTPMAMGFKKSRCIGNAWAMNMAHPTRGNQEGGSQKWLCMATRMTPDAHSAQS